MARKKKVPGWHGMKKDELVKALLRRVRVEAGRRMRGTVKIIPTGQAHHKLPKRLEQIQANSPQAKDLTFRTVVDEATGRPKIASW